MKEFKKEDIGSVIESMFSAMQSEDRTENEKAFEEYPDKKLMKQALKELEEGDYEKFSILSHREFMKPLKGLIESLHLNDDFKFAILNYNLVERHLLFYIERVEGSPCSADKSRTIMKSLLNFLRGGKPIEFNYDQEVTYHLPKKVFNNHDKIFDFFKAVKSLNYGNPNQYLMYVKENMVKAFPKPETELG